jgi:hypothetical protein
MTVITRQMTPEEANKLKGTLPRLHKFFDKEMILSLLGAWITFVLIFTLLWVVVAWFGHAFFDAHFGWNSRWKDAILSVGVLLGGLLVAYAILHQLWFQHRRGDAIRRDIAKGVVNEMRMRIVEAKRFEEPEHGGLLYFLHTSDKKVFTMFDYESQDLGVQGLDPLTRPFCPCNDFVIVQAPESRSVLSSNFTGEQIELAPPLVLSVPPSKWPRFEEFCNTPWEKLETKYSRLTQHSSGTRQKRASPSI